MGLCVTDGTLGGLGASRSPLVSPEVFECFPGVLNEAAVVLEGDPGDPLHNQGSL